MPKLKPCPFCGKTPIIVKHDEFYKVICNTLFCVSMGLFETMTEAIDHWNKRVRDDAEIL